MKQRVAQKRMEEGEGNAGDILQPAGANRSNLGGDKVTENPP